MNGIALAGGRSASISVDADNVTIDGFTIQGNTSQDLSQGAGMVISPNHAGTHVYNNIFQNNVSGLFLANNSATNPAIIYHNVFRNNNNVGNEGGRGIYTNGDLSGGFLTNVQIDANFFYNNRGSSGTTGLESSIAFEALTAGKQSNISITNNGFDNNGKAVLFFNTIGITLTGNVVTQTLDKYSGTFRFEGNNQDVTITGNTLYNNTGPAVAVDSKGVSGFNSGFIVNNNNIYGNSTGWSGSHLGVITDSTAYDGVPDDRFNYWGSAPVRAETAPAPATGCMASVTLCPEISGHGPRGETSCGHLSRRADWQLAIAVLWLARNIRRAFADRELRRRRRRQRLPRSRRLQLRRPIPPRPGRRSRNHHRYERRI